MHFYFMALMLALAPEPAGPTQAPSGEDKAPALGLAAPGLAATETNHDIAYRIGKDIRCPVCQGMSIAESPSAMAQDMMGRVRAMLKDGKTGEEVRAYFVQRYGVWVLLDPPKQGFVLLVWLVPPIVLVGAAALALRHMRRLRQTNPSPEAAPIAAAAGAAPQPRADDYLQAIRDEVRR